MTIFVGTLDKLCIILYNECIRLLKEKEESCPVEIYREFLKVILLRIVDTYWMQHIDFYYKQKSAARKDYRFSALN